MHMADALISPAVGGTMWAAAAGLTAYSARQLKKEMDERKIPLMGVLGALVFAAQMINFTIPGTGSSGHLEGAIVLAILLGPYAAFLTMASILTIQALFFADGGLLALGCNIFNMGFLPCFVAFPLSTRKLPQTAADRKRIVAAAMAASIIGLQLGAFGVVTETVFSDISALSFRDFRIAAAPHSPGDRHCRGLCYGLCCQFRNQDPPRSPRNGDRTIGRQTNLDQARIDYSGHYCRLNRGFSLMVCFRKSRRP